MVGLVKELQNIQKDIQEQLDDNKGRDPLLGQWLSGVNNGLSIAINRLIGDGNDALKKAQKAVRCNE